MKKSSLITGFVLVALAAVVLAGVVLNIAWVNYQGTAYMCSQRTETPEGVRGLAEIEGPPIRASYSLFPLGLKCAYTVPSPGTPVTVFLDLGTVPGGFGASLAFVGALCS